MVTGIALGVLLAACEPLWRVPEKQAQDLIETWVKNPADVERLRSLADLAPNENPDRLLADLAARVGLEFLQAQQDRGASLSFVATDPRRVSDSAVMVLVHVAFRAPDTTVSSDVRFQVYLEQLKDDRWRITRVVGDN